MMYLAEVLNLREASSTVLPPSEVVYLAAGRVATIPQDSVCGMTGLFQLKTAWKEADHGASEKCEEMPTVDRQDKDGLHTLSI